MFNGETTKMEQLNIEFLWKYVFLLWGLLNVHDTEEKQAI